MAIVTLNGSNLTLNGQNVTLSANFSPAVVVGLVNQSFIDAGVTEENTSIIYKVSAGLISYVPGRDINGITGFELDQGYYMVKDEAFDLAGVVVPPL
jgi:hypothetical protein